MIEVRVKPRSRVSELVRESTGMWIARIQAPLRAAVHRRAGRSRRKVGKRRASVGAMGDLPGTARRGAEKLRSPEEGGRGRAGALEVRRLRLVAGGARPDHGEAGVPAPGG